MSRIGFYSLLTLAALVAVLSLHLVPSVCRGFIFTGIMFFITGALLYNILKGSR